MSTTLRTEYRRHALLSGVILLLLTCCLVSRANDAPGMRVWTDSIGRKLRAQLLSVEDDAIMLKQFDGREVKVLIKDLSNSDQQFVAAERKKLQPAKPAKKEPVQQMGGQRVPLRNNVGQVKRMSYLTVRTFDQDGVKVVIEPILKKGDAKKFAQWEDNSHTIVQVGGRSGSRIFEKAATLSYDTAKRHVVTTYQGRERSRAPFRWSDFDEATIKLENSDMVYFYSLHAKTGEAKQLDSFEMDYHITLTPQGKLEWGDVTVKMGLDKPTKEQLAAGLIFDKMPLWIKMEIARDATTGEPAEIKNWVDYDKAYYPEKLYK